jgi:ubiquitin-like protein Pup
MAATKDTGGQKQTTRRAEETEQAEAGNAEEFVRSYVQKGGQ